MKRRAESQVTPQVERREPCNEKLRKLDDFCRSLPCPSHIRLRMNAEDADCATRMRAEQIAKRNKNKSDNFKRLYFPHLRRATWRLQQQRLPLCRENSHSTSEFARQTVFVVPFSLHYPHYI